jgi:RimJ/RimL family protein N-acetyltransferase
MESEMWFEEIELESENIKLIPLTMEHADALLNAANDGALWKLWFTAVPSAEIIDDYITTALEQKAKGLSLPFVVIDKASGEVIGSTRFCNADLLNQRVEIGYTWYSKSYQKTSCNTECKLLLITHAFESLEAIAVEFRTNWHNQASRAAIIRLGAKQDGVLRNHQKMPNGGYRDTVMFSITNTEWPSVKENLTFKLSMYN